jgi:phosphoribosyl 1,2-cyclic phosphodiesterase
MEVTIWGCRGSLPTPGKNTLRFGGNTTCLEVRLADGNVIVIDAGTGIRALGRKLMREEGLNEIYLVLTHSHWDHLMGFPFFAPAYSERFKINVRGGPIAKETIRQNLEQQMQPPYFPVRFSYMKARFDFTHGIPKVKYIGDATVTPIALSHPNGGYGFKFEEGDRCFVFLTDNELEYQHEGGCARYEYANFCREADLLLHDAQYTDEEYQRFKTWGHSTCQTALDLGIQAKVKRIGLFHHDPDRKDEDIDRIVQTCESNLAQRSVRLDFFAAAEGMRIAV